MINVTTQYSNDDYAGTIKAGDFIFKTKRLPTNRNEQKRVDKGEAMHLVKVLPQHRQISLGLYLGNTVLDFDEHGVINPGDYVSPDGNTRRAVWTKCIAERHPDYYEFIDTVLHCVVKVFRTYEELDQWYKTFDSTESLKKPRHIMETAAAFADVSEDRVAKITSMLSKQVKLIKSSHLGKRDSNRKVIEINTFGTDHINAFYDHFESKLNKKVLAAVSPYMAAYRALRVKLGAMYYKAIDQYFEEFLTGNILDKVLHDGSERMTYELHNTLMKESYSYLCPKGSADRIEIVSALIYTYGLAFMIDGKKYCGKRAIVPNSQAGADNMKRTFQLEMLVLES